jgi:oxygen-independent coproporphyrinogen-3 oxidase
MLPVITGMWPYHPDLLERAVPRYTSFPTAAEFRPLPGDGALSDAIAACDGDVSLYLHIPFCEQICWYCGCNTGAANKTQRLTAYLDALMHEVTLVAAQLPDRCRVARIAFGGGSPNAIAPIAFVRLLDRVLTSFSTHAPVISVELDPRGFTEEWAQVLGATGVTHVSLGVQTFESTIQQRIGRVQSTALIEQTVGGLRRHGVRSINFDLMYGLPGQGMAELDETLAATIAMAPERIALFGYAHVPHLLPRQRRIDASALPDQAMRFAMAARGYETLLAAGYVAVGFDHFALPHDPMAQAVRDGTLRRNFQGFTDDQAERLIGMGASAISIFPDRIIQNEKNAGRYRMRLSQDQLTGTLGLLRSRDDRDRGMVIEDILCGRPTDLSQISGLLPLDALRPFIERGLVRLDGNTLSPTDASRPYVRSIAALFDPYRADTPQRFSSAV